VRRIDDIQTAYRPLQVDFCFYVVVSNGCHFSGIYMKNPLVPLVAIGLKKGATGK
jgi:hypothetical protein